MVLRKLSKGLSEFPADDKNFCDEYDAFLTAKDDEMNKKVKSNWMMCLELQKLFNF